MVDDKSAVLKKVASLVKRAQHPTSDDDEEARTAAMTATVLMKEHELVILPRSEIDRINEAIREATKLAKESKSEANNKLIMGVLAGMTLGKGKLFG